METWPVSLKQLLEVEGFTEGEGDSLIETTPDTGPPSSRPRSSAMQRPLDGTIVCTKAQWEALLAFGRTNLLRWSQPFNFPAQGSSDTTWIVKFRAGALPKRVGLGGDIYRVSINLWVMP